MDIIKQLEWRYATKVFNADKKISDADFEELMTATRLAPSSYGLQLWKAFIVKNPETRQQLKGAAYGQSQITDASHLVVFTAPKIIDEKSIDSYIELISEIREVSVESLEGFSTMLKGAVKGKSAAELSEWAGKQAYIALGFILETAALKNIDSCPMEGFDHKKFDEILKLHEKGFESKVVCALGYRSEIDNFQKLKKVRFPKEGTFEVI